MAELRWMVALHGFRTTDSDALLLKPADQPEEFTVALKGVTAQITVDTNTKRELNKQRKGHLMI